MASNLVVLSVTALLASGSVAPEDQTVIELLTRMEHRFAEATLQGDYSSIEKLLAPEFVGVEPHGRELGRADKLAI
jgi:hypothetical protein